MKEALTISVENSDDSERRDITFETYPDTGDYGITVLVDGKEVGGAGIEEWREFMERALSLWPEPAPQP